MPGPGDVDEVRELASKIWLGLTAEQATRMYAVLSTLDLETILSDHVLLHAWGLSAHLALQRDGELDQHSLIMASAAVTSRCARAVQTAQDVDAVVDYGSTLIIGTRLTGDLEGAERAGADVDRRLGELAGEVEAGRPGPRRRERPGQIAMQRGLTQTLLGNFAGALHSYGNAWAARGEPPYRHFAGANAAANAAMLAGVEGHYELAETWLRRVGQYGDRDGWAGYLTYLGEYIARALLACDALDEPAAHQAAEAAGAATQDVELWPFLAVAQSAVELTFGAPHRAAEVLRAASFAHDPDLTWNTRYGGLLLRANLDCLVALGEGDRVLRMARDAGHPSRTLLPVARVLLLGGDNESAAQSAEQAAQRDNVHVRDLRELLLVRAVALLRMGRAEEAGDVFGSFLRFEDRYCAAMIARVPGQDYARLCELCGRTPPAAPGRQGHPTIPLKLVRLTRAEEQVLGLLAEGLTLARVADATYTSVNTVKTHVRSIYRKLDVGSRAEAVARARELGLVE